MPSSKITNNDYKKILLFYNQKINKSAKTNKKNAEKILANKLCKCIKSFKLSSELKSIRICTSKIFKNKGLKRGKFTCKKRKTVKFIKY